MLELVVHQMQAFAAEHGCQPNVLYINPSHYIALIQQCPERLVQGDCGVEISALGLKVVLVPPQYLAEPRVALVMPGISRIYRLPLVAHRPRQHRWSTAT